MYAANRDLPNPPYCQTQLYSSLDELKDSSSAQVRDADFVMVGSYVPEGVAVGEWVTATASGVTAFYDIDTPVTLAKLERGETEYLAPALIPRYDLYLSFTGGPTLKRIETIFEIGKEILIPHSPEDVLQNLREMPETDRCAIGERARARVLTEHTAAHRAAQLEQYVMNVSH